MQKNEMYCYNVPTKKVLGLILTSMLLGSCSGFVSEQDKKEMLTHNLTKENYETFFSVEHNLTYKKTVISPCFNKHLDYKDVVFEYKTDSSYQYKVKVDETGKGEAKDTNKEYSYALRHDLVSIQGTVSFKDDYTSFQKIETLNRDINHKESASISYSLTGTTKYVLSFRTDLNFTKTADTDAFYLIDTVKIKFTTTVNNAQREMEVEAHPNFFGMASVPLEGEYSGGISNVSYEYIKGFYLAY